MTNKTVISLFLLFFNIKKMINCVLKIVEFLFIYLFFFNKLYLFK